MTQNLSKTRELRLRTSKAVIKRIAIKWGYIPSIRLKWVYDTSLLNNESAGTLFNKFQQKWEILTKKRSIWLPITETGPDLTGASRPEWFPLWCILLTCIGRAQKLSGWCKCVKLRRNLKKVERSDNPNYSKKMNASNV